MVEKMYRYASYPQRLY